MGGLCMLLLLRFALSEAAAALAMLVQEVDFELLLDRSKASSGLAVSEGLATKPASLHCRVSMRRRARPGGSSKDHGEKGAMPATQ